jgi:hypothetical protein
MFFRQKSPQTAFSRRETNSYPDLCHMSYEASEQVNLHFIYYAH